MGPHACHIQPLNARTQTKADYQRSAPSAMLSPPSPLKCRNIVAQGPKFAAHHRRKCVCNIAALRCLYKPSVFAHFDLKPATTSSEIEAPRSHECRLRQKKNPRMQSFLRSALLSGTFTQKHLLPTQHSQRTSTRAS